MDVLSGEPLCFVVSACDCASKNADLLAGRPSGCAHMLEVASLKRRQSRSVSTNRAIGMRCSNNRHLGG